MQRQRRDPCRLLLHLFGKGERNSVFVNGDQTETSGGEGVTQDIRDSRGDARQPPCRLGKHQIARLGLANVADGCVRSEEHTTELQSLMRLSYAVFCLKKKNYSVQ